MRICKSVLISSVQADLLHRGQHPPHGSARSATLPGEAHARHHLYSRRQPRPYAFQPEPRNKRDPHRSEGRKSRERT
jgi:hypothetical protein